MVDRLRVAHSFGCSFSVEVLSLSSVASSLDFNRQRIVTASYEYQDSLEHALSLPWMRSLDLFSLNESKMIGERLVDHWFGLSFSLAH
jgi:hypothetical protein